MGFLFVLKRIAWFVFDNWKVILPIAGVLLLVIIGYRFCNRPPKLDEKAIQKAQTAIAEQDRKAMVEVLTEIEVKEKQIDGNAVEAQAETFTAIKNAKEKAAAMTNEQLAAELERKLHE